MATRVKKIKARGLQVWKDNHIDAPTWTLTAKELEDSWKACPYSSEEKMSAPDAPNRAPHTPWPTAYALGSHIVQCMGLFFDGSAGALTHFLDWEVKL